MPPLSRLDAVCDTATTATTNLEALQELCRRVQLLQKDVNDICSRKIPALESSIEHFHETHLHRLLATKDDFRKDLPVYSIGLLLSSIDSLFLKTENCFQKRWTAARRSFAAESSCVTILAVGYSPETAVCDSALFHHAGLNKALIMPCDNTTECQHPAREQMTRSITTVAAQKPAAAPESKPVSWRVRLWCWCWRR
ncbi:hypothetical protein, conserved [Leishmania tarentolae]|uniref:Uncharacterized protein n=1 Tax=Leishmania tarentolae TaxID=5689 RepID=A0A640KKL6_LEITA|nr:hypothetical protein, conserved [Leishmania tarentolae]